MEDAGAAANRVAQSRPIMAMFSNPFIASGVATVVLLIILYIMIPNIPNSQFWRLSAFTYLSLLLMLFVNNRQLIREIKGAFEKPSWEFTDVSEDILDAPGKYKGFEPTPIVRRDVVGEDEDEPEAAAELPERPKTIPDIVEKTVPSLYPIDWLSA